ncbi:hypothetical protein, partial [Ralstonia pseudosolanacearum]|uniref:hypothetical protein n=1 Tax=Ralstonia pseudosolanacearum TaxID=1310165 RepID=UPI001E51E97B
LEFLGVSLRAHRTSCLTSSLRLTGVYLGRGDSPQNEEAYQTESYDTKPKHSRVVLSRIYRVSNREVSTVDGMRADGGK